MNRLKTGLVIAAAGASAGFLASRIVSSRKSAGEQLELEMWDLLREGMIDEVADRIAPSFQGVHQNAILDRDHEIEMIRNMAPGDYKISDLKAVQDGSTYVVTYKVSVEETINGKRLPAVPSFRQSVWINTDDGWKLIAHSNLRSLN